MGSFSEIKHPDILPLDLCAYQFGAAHQRLGLTARWLAIAVFSAELSPVTQPTSREVQPGTVMSLNSLELGVQPRYVEFSRSRSPETGQERKLCQLAEQELDQICKALRAALPPLEVLMAYTTVSAHQELAKVFNELGEMLDKLKGLPGEIFDFPRNTPRLWDEPDFQENYHELIEPISGEEQAGYETPEDHSRRVRLTLSAWASDETKLRTFRIYNWYQALYQQSNLEFPFGWYQTGRNLEVEKLEKERTLSEIIPIQFRVPAGPTNRFQILRSLEDLGFREVPDPQSGEQSHVQSRLLGLHRDLIQKQPKFETQTQPKPDKIVYGGHFQLTLNITKRLLVREGFEPVTIEQCDLEVVKHLVQNPQLIPEQVNNLGTGGTNTKFSSTARTKIDRANKKCFLPLNLEIESTKGKRSLCEKKK
jgi:hypothetical protein